MSWLKNSGHWSEKEKKAGSYDRALTVYWLWECRAKFINQGNELAGIRTETYQSTPGIKDDPLCSWSCYEEKTDSITAAEATAVLNDLADPWPIKLNAIMTKMGINDLSKISKRSLIWTIHSAHAKDIQAIIQIQSSHRLLPEPSEWFKSNHRAMALLHPDTLIRQ